MALGLRRRFPADRTGAICYDENLTITDRFRNDVQAPLKSPSRARSTGKATPSSEPTEAATTAAGPKPSSRRKQAAGDATPVVTIMPTRALSPRGRKKVGTDPGETKPPAVVPSVETLLFDPDWYRTQYPDVALAGVDPIRHYFDDGAREGRDPNPFFSTSGYLARYADVVASRMNPFLHYVLYGAREGRSPNA